MFRYFGEPARSDMVLILSTIGAHDIHTLHRPAGHLTLTPSAVQVPQTWHRTAQHQTDFGPFYRHVWGTWTADEVGVRSSVDLGYTYRSCGPVGERIRTISGRGGSPDPSNTLLLSFTWDLAVFGRFSSCLGYVDSP